MASDSVNGPLIGVIDASGEALAKEGSLSAGWQDEYGNVARHGPGQRPGQRPADRGAGHRGRPGRPAAGQTGALDAAWDVENTDVAPGAFDVSG